MYVVDAKKILKSHKGKTPATKENHPKGCAQRRKEKKSGVK